MIRFSRSLATRLRRAAFPAPRPLVATSLVATALVATAPTDAWGRFQAALAVTDLPAHELHEREFVEENLRLAVTLLGQQGPRAWRHVLAACDGELDGASASVRIALSLGEAVGLAV